MAVRTIGVNITGKKGIEEVSNLVTNVKNSLASLEKTLAGLKDSAISFKVNIDTDQTFGQLQGASKRLSNHKDSFVKFRIKLTTEGIATELKNAADEVSKLDDSKVELNLGFKAEDFLSQVESLKTSIQKRLGSFDVVLNAKEGEVTKAPVTVDEIREGIKLRDEYDARRRDEETAHLKSLIQMEKDALKDIHRMEDTRREKRQAQLDEEKAQRKLEAQARQSSRWADFSTLSKELKEFAPEVAKEYVDFILDSASNKVNNVKSRLKSGEIVPDRDRELANSSLQLVKLLVSNYVPNASLSRAKYNTINNMDYFDSVDGTHKPGLIVDSSKVIRNTKADQEKIFRRVLEEDSSLRDKEGLEEFLKSFSYGMGIDLDKPTQDVRELNDRFLETIKALETIGELADSVTQKLTSFIRMSANYGAVLPAKTLANIYSQATRQIVSSSLSMGRHVGTNLVGGFRQGFHIITSYARQMLSGISQDVQELSDAMVGYRNNMSILGLSESQINKNLKDLGDYGKKTVYSADDLLKMSGNYVALGFDSEEAINMTKAMAGLVANRADSHLGIAKATKQLEQILTKGKASTEDLNTMRQWFNAIGVKRFNEGLSQIAEDAGYGSDIMKATREGALTAEKIRELVVRVGTSEDIQDLVTNISTPSQALANLRESLANLLSYDKIIENPDGTFSRGDAPLTKLYKSTVTLIRGISETISTDKFEQYATNFGNSVSRVIEFSISLGDSINRLMGRQGIRSLETFFLGVSKGFSEMELSTRKHMQGLVSAVFDTFNSKILGKDLSVHLSRVFNNTMELLTVIARNLDDASLYYLSYVGQFTDFLGNLFEAVERVNGFKVISQLFSSPLKALNKIVKDRNNIVAFARVFESVSSFVKDLFGLNGLVEYIASSAGLVNAASLVLHGLAKAFRVFNNTFRTNINSAQLKRVFDSLAVIINQLTRQLGKIYGEMLASLVRVGSSRVGERFFQAISRFIVSVNKAIMQALRELGNGSIDRGVEKILGFLTSLLNLASKAVTLMGNFPRTTMVALLIGKAIGFITTLGQGLMSLQEALRVLGVSGGLSLGGVGAEGTGLMGYLGSGRFGNYFNNKGPLAGVSIRESLGNAFSSGTGTFSWRGVGGSLKDFGRNSLARLWGGAKALPGKSWASLKGMPSAIKNNFGTLKGDLIATGINMGTIIVDGMVQSSSASKNVKKASTFVSNLVNLGVSTWTGASFGAAVGSPTGVGALAGGLIGGVLGFGKGVHDWVSGDAARKQAEEEQKQYEKEVKQALEEEKRLKKELFISRIQEVRDQAEVVRRVLADHKGSRYSVGDGSEKAFESSFGLYQTMLNQLNQSDTADTLGLARVILPSEIDDLSIKIGDTYKGWAELKSELGLNDEDLLKVVQLTYANTDKALFELYKHVEGQGMVKAYEGNTLTPQFREQQAQKFQTLVAGINNIGVNLGEITEERVNKFFGDYEDYINSVENLAFVNDEEEKEFLADILSNGNKEVKEALKGRALNDLRTYSADLNAQIEEYLKSPTDVKLDQMERLTKLGFDLEKEGEMGRWFGMNQEETAKLQDKAFREELAKKAKKFPEIRDWLNGKFAEEVLVNFDDFDSYTAEIEGAIDEIKTKRKRVKKELGIEKPMIDMLTELRGEVESKVLDSLLENAVDLDELNKMLSEVGYDQAWGRMLNDTQKEQLHEFVDKLDLSAAQTTMMKHILETTNVGIVDALNQVLEQAKFTANIEDLGVPAFVEEISNAFGIMGEKTKSGLGLAVQSLNQGTDEGATSFVTRLTALIDEGRITTVQASQIIESVRQQVENQDLSGLSSDSLKVLESLGYTVDSTSGKLVEIGNKAKVDTSKVDTSPVTNASSNIGAKLANVALGVANALAEIASSIVTPPVLGVVPALVNPQPTNNVASPSTASRRPPTSGRGHIAYLSSGGLSRGTDTVPAMLTPGEYVIRKKAVESVGVGFLRNLNTNGVRALQNSTRSSIIYNVYNNNNARVNQNIDNKSQYLNGMLGLDRLMRYV